MMTERGKLEADSEKLNMDLQKLLTLDDPDRLNLVEFRVIEPPQIPVSPTGPNRLLMFGAAGVLAAGAGLGLAFLRTQLADNMPTVRHVKRAFDLPVLGGVSMMESRGSTAKTIAGTVGLLAGTAAFVSLLGFVAYKYHFQLWRPDISSLLTSARHAIGVLGASS